MQHKEWQEQIPFYVAQTLSPDEIRHFEAHLINCATCQQEIADWRGIASAVWREADDAAQNLPPLSQDVYNRLNYRDRAPQSRYSTNPPRSQTNDTPENVHPLKQTNRSSFPLTLVAGLVVAVIFGGLLMTFALRPTQTASEIALNLTDSNSMTEQFGSDSTVIRELTPTQTPITDLIPTISSSPEPTETLIQGPPIFVTNTALPSATAIATLTPVPTNIPETVTPVPIATQDSSSISAIQEAATALPPTVTATPTIPAPIGGGPYITVTPGTFAEGLPACEAFNPTNSPIEIFTQADRNSEIVDVILPGQIIPVTDTSTTGWYTLRLSNDLSGWLQSGFAYLRGNCLSSLPVATVIASPTSNIIATPVNPVELPENDTIVAINASFADLYAGPDFNSTVLGLAERDQQFPVVGYQGTGDNRWVLVRLADNSEAWLWASVVIEYPANEAPVTATP